MTWQLFVSICAGVVTVINVLEKLGIITRIKRVEADSNELKKLVAQITDIQENQQQFGVLQKDQNCALLAILRSDLYQSFKDHRDIGAWTDDEANVQTKLHAAYRALNGNGEEEIWWEKKKTWDIVSNEEYKELLAKHLAFEDI